MMKSISCNYEGQSTTGQIEVRQIPKHERLLRTAKLVGTCWAVAIFCVLIPILHFVLVPGFIGAGVFLGYSTWVTKTEITSGEFLCPNCKKINLLKDEADAIPQNRRCTSCTLTIEVR